jgi:hypothetical protein
LLPAGLLAVSVYVVVTVGVTDTAALPTGLLLAPVTGPFAESIFTLVAPFTTQLRVELWPLVMVWKKAVKLAMTGGCLKAVAAALFGRHPVMSANEVSSAAIAKTAGALPKVATHRTRTAGRGREFAREMDFIRLLLLELGRHARRLRELRCRCGASKILSANLVIA